MFPVNGQETLPGLEIQVQTGAGAAPPTATELAAAKTLGHLNDAGVLRPEHALHVQLILDLARAVGLGVATGKASAVAMAAKQLTEAMALLPELPAAPADDEDAPAGGPEWRRFLAASDAAEAAEHAALAAGARSEAPVGDWA